MNTRLMDWYIGKTTFLAMVVVTLCGGLLMFVFTLLDALPDAEEQGGFLAALDQTVRTMPRKIEELAPFAVFLGVLIGMGSLSSNSELTVFRSTGVSVTRLFASACIPSVLMIILAQTLIPLIFAADERGASSIDGTIDAAWVRESDTFTRIGSITSSETLREVSQYRLNEEGNLTHVREARSARPKNAEGGWELEDVTDTSIETRRIEVTRPPSATWETPRSADSLMSAFTVEPRKMSLVQLYEQINDLREAGEDATEYQIEFWLKLTKPLSVLGLVLIAIGFVVGSTREMGMGARLTFGIAVGFAFHYFQTLVAPVTVVFALPPAVAISVPILMVWTIGLVLLHRIR
ncbi:MAG: LPS export ABC transporter permease LptG [Gammaproteobacteria bacterium]|nr:LPS export ABC transporter permease LptG [Gammaproteobacteria bacterium]